MRYTAILLALMASSALADEITIGPEGIDSKATGLDGDGIEIGQIESGRSGKPGYGTPPEDSASNTKPEQVYFRTMVALPGEAVREHASMDFPENRSALISPVAVKCESPDDAAEKFR